MGLYKKKGKNWYLDYRWPRTREGKRIRECVGPDKEEADIILAERLKDMRQGRNPELRRIKPKPFEEMVTEFLEKHARRCRDYDGFKKRTDALLVRFERRTLQDMTPREINAYIADRLAEGISKATANRLRAVLSKIFSCAIAWGYYGGENPVRQVKRFAEPAGRARFLTADEASRLVKGAPKHLRPVIVCALHTGGRLSEILRLRWEDVDLDRGVLYFDQRNTKSGKQREIPIDADLLGVLQERKKVRAISGDGRDFILTRYGRRLGDVRTAFDVARKRAELGGDVTFHTLRHTFASWYVLNGGDLYRLQKYLGHSTITLTQRYAHLSQEHLQAGAQFFGPPKEARGHQVDTEAPPDAVSEAASS